MQQRCNRGATSGATSGATEMQHLVQQRCNSGGASKSAARAELRRRRRRRRGCWRVGGGGGQMPSKHDAQIARMEEVGRGRGVRVKTTRVETCRGRPDRDSPPEVARPSHTVTASTPPQQGPRAGGGPLLRILRRGPNPAAGNSAPGPAARGGRPRRAWAWVGGGGGGRGRGDCGGAPCVVDAWAAARVRVTWVKRDGSGPGLTLAWAGLRGDQASPLPIAVITRTDNRDSDAPASASLLLYQHQ